MIRRFVLASLVPLLAGASAQGEDGPSGAGWYQCHLKHGELEFMQNLTAEGHLTAVTASWVEPRGLHDRKSKADRHIANPAYMTISVDSRTSPAKAEPDWFDIAGAKVQITVVTRRKLRGAAAIDFRRPSRTGDLYEPALSLSAENSRAVPWSIVSLPYRVLDAFAERERQLDWMLLRWVGGDLRWDIEEQGSFDLRKVEAFAQVALRAKPALSAQRARYREQCEHVAPAEVQGEI